MHRAPRTAISAVLVLFAFGAGWWLGRNDHQPALPQPALASSALPANRSPLTDASLAAAESASNASPETTPRRITMSQALWDYLKAPDHQLFNPLAADETTLSPEAVALLDISPEEQRQVEAALLRTRDNMHRLCRENFKVVRNDKDNAVLTLPPLPQAQVLKQTLAQDLSQALGDDRATMILDRMYKDSFMRFGAGEQTIEIEWKKDLVVVQRRYKDGASEGSSLSGSSTLPELYEDLLAGR